MRTIAMVQGLVMLRHRISLTRASIVLVALSTSQHGYRFLAFTSGCGGVQFPNADVVRRGTVLNDFEESLISTTPNPGCARPRL
jgi:hypothetical protein